MLFLLCCLTFFAAYLSVNHAFGQGQPTDQAPPPEVSATLAPDLTFTPTAEASANPHDAPLVTPTEGATPSATAPAETPAPGNGPRSFDELGERAEAGSVFEKYGVRLQIPEGFGDFRVMYPVIVDWGFAPDVDHPNLVMTVYNPQTHSSVFLSFEEGAEGPRPVELGRHVEQPEGDAAVDQIVSTMEVAR